uniref:Uncharacterized protein n=1 Tax=Panagrellus redivivus TaxID=6233 RepID=A0A7E4VBV4_PANRE
MYSRFVLLILCLAVGFVQGEVKLTKGRNLTVSFKGEELTIVVDNTLGGNSDFTICFGGSPDATHPPCPLGFARFALIVGGNKVVRFTINRKGQFVDNNPLLETQGNIKFNDDGTFNIMVVQLPDAKTTVTLPNAETFVPEKQLDVIVPKKKSNVGTAEILAIIIVLIVVCVIVGILVWCCITCKSKPKQIPKSDHQDNSPPSQQFRHRRMSTLRKSSVKAADQTCFKHDNGDRPKHITVDARKRLAFTNRTSINNIDNSMSEAYKHRAEPAFEAVSIR